jgi:hypothetical protein
VSLSPKSRCAWPDRQAYSGSAITSWRCWPRPAMPSSTTSPAFR